MILVIILFLFIIFILSKNNPVYYKLKEKFHINNSIRIMDSEYRGLYTPFLIFKNNIIVSIDNNDLINFKDLVKLYKIDNMDEYNYENSLFAYNFIVLEEKNDEKWNAYLDSLPKNNDNFIFYYKDKELVKYLYPKYMDDLRLFGSDARKLYQHNLKHKFIKKNYTEEEFSNKFFYYLFLTNSRTFLINNNIETVIVPYCDLFNHSRKSNAKWKFDKKTNKFNIISTKHILPFEEIVLDYGHQCNSTLLYNYGFTIDSNKPIMKIYYNNKSYEIDKEDNLDRFIKENKIDGNDFILFLQDRYRKNITYLEKDIPKDVRNVLNDENKIIKNLLYNNEN